MRYLIYTLLLLSLVLISCEKENLLEPVKLVNNPDENPALPYVSIESYGFPIRCSQVYMSIKVHLDRLPEGMEYTRQRIEGPNGESYLATRTTPLFVEVVCGQTNTIYISLVNEVLDKESPRFAFEINP